MIATIRLFLVLFTEHVFVLDIGSAIDFERSFHFPFVCCWWASWPRQIRYNVQL